MHTCMTLKCTVPSFFPLIFIGYWLYLMVRTGSGDIVENAPGKTPAFYSLFFNGRFGK